MECVKKRKKEKGKEKLQEKRKKYDGSNNVEKNTHLQFLMICASEIIEVLN